MLVLYHGKDEHMGVIRINLSPDHARQIWGRSIFWKKPEQEKIELFPMVGKIKDLPGVSGVWYTDDKNSEILATIKKYKILTRVRR